MTSPADFHRLDSRLRIRGRLVAATALHIGSAQCDGQGSSDMPVLRDGRGLPFIPGTSLKGVLRSTIEGMVRAAEDRSVGLFACDPLEDGCGLHEPTRRKDVDPERHCAVCRLMGSHVLASHVRISDALLSERDQLEAGVGLIEVRDGVAIDRDLGLASTVRKYDFEVVAAGATFDLEVFVENPRPWLMGLLTIGWDQVAAGYTALGGFTSRGLGRVELHWESGERYDAAGLLAGREPTRWNRDGLVVEQQRWRQALADRLAGGTHVRV